MNALLRFGLLGLLSCAMLLPQTSKAQVTEVTEAICKKNWDLIQQLSRTCLTCLFPITFLSIPLFGSDSELPNDRADPFCICPGRFGYPSLGITMGWWSPSHTIEMVRQPWCMPSLGGYVLTDDKESGVGLGTPGRWGGSTESSNKEANTYYNFHWYKFPIDYLLGFLSDYACSKKSSTGIDIAFMSEFDPSWNNDALALWTGPEAKLFAAPWAVISCAADGVAATASKPMRPLYYCAGSWGMVFPLSGNEPSNSDLPRSVSLLATRGIAKMHRYGIASRTYGNSAICNDTKRFILEKQQHKFQMLFPMVEKKSGRMGVGGMGGSNHWIGSSTFKWGGEWSTQPTNEDHIYLHWQYKECCITFW